MCTSLTTWLCCAMALVIVRESQSSKENYLVAWLSISDAVLQWLREGTRKVGVVSSNLAQVTIRIQFERKSRRKIPREVHSKSSMQPGSLLIVI